MSDVRTMSFAELYSDYDADLWAPKAFDDMGWATLILIGGILFVGGFMWLGVHVEVTRPRVRKVCTLAVLASTLGICAFASAALINVRVEPDRPDPEVMWDQYVAEIIGDYEVTRMEHHASYGSDRSFIGDLDTDEPAQLTVTTENGDQVFYAGLDDENSPTLVDMAPDTAEELQRTEQIDSGHSPG